MKAATIITEHSELCRVSFCSWSRLPQPG